MLRGPVATKRIHRRDGSRKRAVEPIEQSVFIDEGIGTARFKFQQPDLADEVCALFEPASAQSRRAGHKSFPDKDFSRLLRMRLRIMTAATGIDDQLSGGHPLPRVNKAGAVIPVDIVVDICAEPRCNLFEPLRLDFGVTASEHTRRFNQRKRKHKIGRTLPSGESGTGENQIFFPAHIRKQTRLAVVSAELTRQTAEEHLVKRIVRETLQINFSIRNTAVFRHDRGQIIDKIPPLANPAEVQIVSDAETPESLIGIFRAELLQCKPEIQDADEIRFVGLESAMRGIRFRRFLERSFTRIRNAQKSDNHKHFRKDLAQVRFEQHPAQLRIQRKRGERTSDARQPCTVQRTQVVQRAHAFTDQCGGGFIDQRKLSERRKIQRSHLKNDAGKRGTLNLRRRELRAFVQRLFGIKMNADAVAQTAAASAALARASPGNLFHAQLLNPRARIVAAQPHKSGINHIADSRNGQ